jgi:hypothetical protein
MSEQMAAQTPITELLRGAPLAEGWRTTSENLVAGIHMTRMHGDLLERAADELDKRQARIAELEAVSERRRSLLERAYHAACKPDWEEGECLNEVLSNIEWEAISLPATERAAAEGEES